MSELMWGGVPYRVPSSTAIKYLSGAVKVKREAALRIGGRYNARQTMEKELVGHRQARNDMLESFETYDELRRRAKSMDTTPQATCSGVCKSQLSTGDEYWRPMNPVYYHERSCCFRPTLTRCPIFKSTRPQIGWTEPRTEWAFGMRDVRTGLPGYVGGRRVRQADDI